MKQSHLKFFLIALILCIITYSIKLNSVRKELEVCQENISKKEVTIIDGNGIPLKLTYKQVQLLAKHYYVHLSDSAEVALFNIMYCE